MAGKRLLDAAAIFQASRAVASGHFSIRQQQFNLYTKTSSLAKAISKQQSHGSAIIRPSAKSTAPFSQKTGSSKVGPESQPVPSTDSTQRLASTATGDQDLNTDFHYGTADTQATKNSSREQLGVVQEQAAQKPLPDGTIPPKKNIIGADIKDPGVDGKKELSSTGARIAQRKSEAQIPSKTAVPPEGDIDSLGYSAGPDTFSDRPKTASSVLSGLPRAKIPRNAENSQGGDPRVDNNTNSDTFYSSKDEEGKADVVRGQESLEEPSEEVMNQLFHSPRAGKVLMHSAATKPSGIVDGHDNAHANDKFGEDLGPSTKVKQVPQTEESQVAYQMKESRVPSTRFGRLWEYSGLAASMALGAAGERMRRAAGSDGAAEGSMMLTSGNMELLVAKLSKMRGAALKLGQMMSFQDSKMLPRPIQEVLQRVQDSADYMPSSQRDSVLAKDLGSDWRNLFESFEEKPMAAASIGQVHGAILKSNGQRVAVKVQYPGVAASISSDLDNLSLLLTASRLLPKGLYLDKTIANARVELSWECDYVREAECAQKFKELLSNESDIFTVPTIYREASGKQVLTMERMEGQAVTKAQNLSQGQRDWIGRQILRLCLREIMEFQYMQTDPNWTNFLYNNHTNKLELLDFGASRGFPAEFIDLYIQNLAAAARGDRNTCREVSIKLGYLTGYESQAMLNTHIDSVLTLAEPFTDSAPDVYDFSGQTITERVKNLIPVMIRERLAPPPEETYSLHRKLSGAFLLCARLGSRVECKELFQSAIRKCSATSS